MCDCLRWTLHDEHEKSFGGERCIICYLGKYVCSMDVGQIQLYAWLAVGLPIIMLI